MSVDISEIETADETADDTAENGNSLLLESNLNSYARAAASGPSPAQDHRPVIPARERQIQIFGEYPQVPARLPEGSVPHRSMVIAEPKVTSLLPVASHSVRFESDFGDVECKYNYVQDTGEYLVVAREEGLNEFWPRFSDGTRILLAAYGDFIYQLTGSFVFLLGNLKIAVMRYNKKVDATAYLAAAADS